MMMVPRGVNLIFPRKNAQPPHFSVSFALRVQSCDLGSADQIHRDVDAEVIYEREQVGDRASILLVQMVGEVVWF